MNVKLFELINLREKEKKNCRHKIESQINETNLNNEKCILKANDET